MLCTLCDEVFGCTLVKKGLHLQRLLKYFFIKFKQALVNSLYKIRAVAFFIATILISTLASGQDIHYSQFGNSPVNLSPGIAGVFGGDMRFAANYRNQWKNVPVPYNTFTGSVENKFYFKDGAYTRFFTGGLLFNYDRQGTLELTSLNIGIPISFTAPLAKNHFLTLGVTPSFGQRSFSTNTLTFDNQWVDCIFDPANAHRENQAFANSSLSYFDISAGLNYRLQSSSRRSKLDFGGSIFHINQPKHNFWAGGANSPDVRLSSRINGYALGVLQVASKVDLVTMAQLQKQGTYRELVYGLAGRFHLNTKPNKELALQAGLGFRHRYTDAIIPQVEVLYRTWQLGLSYDMNLSNFDLATNRRGGPELSLIYRLYKVKPLPVFKSCPII